MGFYNELKSSFGRIVFDTSILTHDCPCADEKYRQSLDFLLDSGKMKTVPDVFREAREYLQSRDKELLEGVRANCVDTKKLDDQYRKYMTRIIPEARQTGVLNEKKRFPLTDIEIAALTLASGHKYRTALLSGDRMLNELVQREIDNRNARDRIVVYSFLTRSAWYVPYLEERTKLRQVS